MQISCVRTCVRNALTWLPLVCFYILTGASLSGRFAREGKMAEAVKLADGTFPDLFCNQHMIELDGTHKKQWRNATKKRGKFAVAHTHP